MEKIILQPLQHYQLPGPYDISSCYIKFIQVDLNDQNIEDTAGET